MIDTIRFEVLQYLAGEKPPANDKLTKNGWIIHEYTRRYRKDEGVASFQIVTFEHKETRTKIWKFEGKITKVETSLPRLIFPTNGFLIRDEVQLNQAISRLHSLIDEIAGDSKYNLTKIIRIDLVWQFLGNIAEYSAVYSMLRHPEIESEPSVWSSNNRINEQKCSKEERMKAADVAMSQPLGLSWKGDKQCINLYDKVFEQNRASDPRNTVIRLEYKITDGESIKKVMASSGKLSFGNCYDLYRLKTDKFKAKPWMRSPESPLRHLVVKYARAEPGFGPESWRQYIATMKPYKRRRIQKALLECAEFKKRAPSLAERFTADGPPLDSPDVSPIIDRG